MWILVADEADSPAAKEVDVRNVGNGKAGDAEETREYAPGRRRSGRRQ